MARYLILPLVLLLVIAGLLAYVGNDPWVNILLLPTESATNANKSLGISLQAAIIGMVCVVALIIIIWSLLVWVWRLPNRMKLGFGRQRHTNGLDALEDALLAGEAGDGERARKKARRAHDLLNRPALSELVSAKAAEAAGDTQEAIGHYKKLLKAEKTKPVGLRGLARMAADQGDHKTAIEMANTAYSPNKGPSWAFDILFKSQIAQNNWDDALESLSLAEKRKHVEKPIVSRRKAVILSAKSSALEKEDKHKDALAMALRAVDANTHFAPATALAVRLLTDSGQEKKAASLLEKAWAKFPHPALALSYSDLYSQEDDKVRTKKIAALIKVNPDHRESLILLAQEALRNNNAVDCLQHLNPLLSTEDPSARLCHLASAAEEKLGNDVDARAWHFRSTTAPIEADWSDLDPDGPAFDYTQTDWQRLVMSFGETGELIHPRHETYKRRRSVVPKNADVKDADNVTTDTKNNPPKTAPSDKISPEPPRPDDPGIINTEKANGDLSQRLGNLLDNKTP